MDHRYTLYIIITSAGMGIATAIPDGSHATTVVSQRSRRRSMRRDVVYVDVDQLPLTSVTYGDVVGLVDQR